MIIRSTLGVLALCTIIGLCAGSKVTASSCGRAEVQAACAGQHSYVRVRAGQVRRAQRREARAARRSYHQATRAACHVATNCAAPMRCSGVAVMVPVVEVTVGAACSTCE